MPERLEFPEYQERARARFLALQPDGNKSAFARARNLETYQIPRWLEAPPATFSDLLRWAEALEVPWAWLVAGEQACQEAARWKPGAIPEPRHQPPDGRAQRRAARDRRGRAVSR